MGPHFRMLKPSSIVTSLLMVGVLSAGQSGGVYPTKKPYVRTGNEVTLSGTIKLTGKRAKPRRIDMSADLVCYQVNPDPKTEEVVGSKEKLANVLVYVKNEALDLYTFEQPGAPAVLEHKGCRYVPHVLGVRVGQPLTIRNSDPTYHNTHPTPSSNLEWNQSQSPGSPPLKKTFDQPDFIPFKDNQHPWERAYVGVFAHPFFAISDESGNYRIEGLPPGRYTVVFRHETLGEKTVDVTFVPGEVRDLSFSFGAQDH
jgi:hypothetical protein